MPFFSVKSLTVALGISLCSVTGYLIYIFLKDDEDDYNSDIISSKYKITEIVIPKDNVGMIIGRKGNKIKEFEQLSNTKISFKDHREDKKMNICIIKGVADSCLLAEQLIMHYIDNQQIIECETMWVPHGAVGKIIGRCGDRITEITKVTGAQITVDSERTNNIRKVTLKGSANQINLAKSYIEDIIEKYNESKASLEASLAKREPRMPSKHSQDLNKAESPKVERMSPIPGQSDSPFEVYVSAMIDPSRFWVQIVGPKATELDVLVENMTEYYKIPNNRDGHIRETVSKGDLVAATFQYDNKWYRAEVLNVTEDEKENSALLYYVDYGDTDTVACKDLFELRTDFLRLHFQAIECFLAKVEPVGEEWSSGAIDKFEEWTHAAQWRKLSAKINGYCVREKTRAKREGSPVPGVDLFDVNNDQDVDIAEELVRNGHAAYKKESEKPSRSTSVSNVSVESSP
ncbi:PREDICTED: tudor and KH domain-containing protein-like [Nicrophorus vespilloides]|uniref:Tudor and KH domain-containing protein-like n=1 Tax=Nicrophorus vespilloides TaxID=110193 RepID=A0ABM1NDV4_NICVS|nr:PREDICTED: tudor and KH domain-containing protein-like [Nicrophorus vespilloides]